MFLFDCCIACIYEQNERKKECIADLEQGREREEKAIQMKILTTTANSYTFEFGMVGSDAKQTGTVIKL